MTEISKEHGTTMAGTRPRFLFRRLVAFMVDIFLAGVVAQLLVFPFLGDTDHIRLSGGIYQTSCWRADPLPSGLKQVVGDDLPDIAVICETRVYGVDNGRTAILVWAHGSAENGGKVNLSRRISFPVDNQGHPVHPIAPDSILQAVLFLFGSVFFLKRWRGQTPGKKLLRLRVAGDPSGYMRREFFRQLPIIAGVFLGQATALIPIPMFFTSNGMATAFVFSGGVFVLYFWYYVVPLFRWRGAMRYDKVTWVERA